MKLNNLITIEINFLNYLEAAESSQNSVIEEMPIEEIVQDSWGDSGWNEEGWASAQKACSCQCGGGKKGNNSRRSA